MVEEIIDAGVCMYGYIFISCMQKKKKKVLMNSGIGMFISI